MTADERKRGLRAAVEAKIHSFSPDFRMLYPDQINLLWEIIDSLVEEVEDLSMEICGVASDHGLYDGEDADSAMTCLRNELSGYSALMWKLQRICNADSAHPDDVLAGGTKLRDELNLARNIRPADTPKEEA